MTVILNGEARPIPQDATIASLLAELKLEARNVAVEVNLAVVPRQRHGDVVLHEGDRLEIVTLVGGG